MKKSLNLRLVISAIVLPISMCLSTVSAEKYASPEAKNFQSFLSVQGDRYEALYNKHMFKKADTNGDTFLSKSELKENDGWVGGFILSASDDRIRKADTDGDNKISLKEAKAQKYWEKNNRAKLTKKYQKQLKAWYVNKVWLKDHPKVVNQLVSYSDYLNSHPKAAKAIYSNKKWLSQHQAVAITLFENKEWLAQHPKAAKELYSDRKWLAQHPRIAKAANRTKEWLAQHPNITKELHSLIKNNNAS